MYPDGESAFTLYEDDGTSNEYPEGGFATTRFSCLQSGGRIVLTVDPVQGGHDGSLRLMVPQEFDGAGGRCVQYLPEVQVSGPGVEPV
jgi:hypothetical protein